MLSLLFVAQAVTANFRTYSDCAAVKTVEYERSGESAGDVATAVVVQCSSVEGAIHPDSVLAKLNPKDQREFLELQKKIRREQIIRDVVEIRAKRRSKS